MFRWKKINILFTSHKATDGIDFYVPLQIEEEGLKESPAKWMTKHTSNIFFAQLSQLWINIYCLKLLAYIVLKQPSITML